MDNMEKLLRYGFSEYSDTSLYRIGSIDKVHIDLSSSNEYNLFSRIIDKDVKFLKDNGRFILFNDNDDIIMDVLVNNITNTMMKSYGDVCREIAFTLNSIQYRMFLYKTKTNEVVFY